MLMAKMNGLAGICGASHDFPRYGPVVYLANKVMNTSEYDGPRQLKAAHERSGDR
jgi:hypothetical protein